MEIRNSIEAEQIIREALHLSATEKTAEQKKEYLSKLARAEAFYKRHKGTITNKFFAEALKRVLDTKKLGQINLSLLLGDPALASKLLAGEVAPSKKVAILLNEYLGISYEVSFLKERNRAILNCINNLKKGANYTGRGRKKK